MRTHRLIWSAALAATATTLLANVPAVWCGQALLKRVPLKAVRIGAALLFLVLGLWLAAETAGWL